MIEESFTKIPDVNRALKYMGYDSLELYAATNPSECSKWNLEDEADREAIEHIAILAARTLRDWAEDRC